MPTIRVDDDVYTWLQNQARPFEDTPNSVLRRVAGIDKKSVNNSNEIKRETKIQNVHKRQLSGRMLNEKWGVRAAHALYHKDGTWFNNLERFPGALFDPNGYVVFKSKDEYERCAYLTIGMETNVPSGISKIPNYVRVIR